MGTVRERLAGDASLVDGYRFDGSIRDQGYLLNNAWPKERQRLRALELIYDPMSIARLDALGVSEGWTCLEVGAGGGSIARWLAERIGPTGIVVATDIDTRFVESPDLPNLEVRRHDITRDALERDRFDLVHVRAVLEHLPERDAILGRLVESLKPGGWLLAEDAQWDSSLPEDDDAVELSRRVWAAGLRLGALAGSDGRYALKLPRALRSHGLVDVGDEGAARLVEGASAESAFFILSVDQVYDRLVALGFVERVDLDRYTALWEDPNFVATCLTLLGAWGRKLTAEEAVAEIASGAHAHP
jgi:SAM-dependent methyltransferase